MNNIKKRHDKVSKSCPTHMAPEKFQNHSLYDLQWSWCAELFLLVAQLAEAGLSLMVVSWAEITAEGLHQMSQGLEEI